ncbi:MAG: DMT family transporter [Acidobacteriota bacterium]
MSRLNPLGNILLRDEDVLERHPCEKVLETIVNSTGGLITGLYAIIVPILGIFLLHRPAATVWIGAYSAVIGLYLLSIGWLSSKMNPIMIAFVQFIICSVLSFIASFLFEMTTLADLAAVTIPILYTGVLSVGVAHTLQVVAQREAPPAHAAIILSLETVFAALGGWLILGEMLSIRALFGCGFMLTGFVVSQIGRRSDLSRKPAQAI